eukprot:COSAG01_NODE_3832_length_5650_cov_80.957485_2_plen_84_part_00
MAAGLSTPPKLCAPRPQVGGSDHHQAYSHLIPTLLPPGNLVIISYSRPRVLDFGGIRRESEYIVPYCLIACQRDVKSAARLRP